MRDSAAAAMSSTVARLHVVPGPRSNNSFLGATAAVADNDLGAVGVQVTGPLNKHRDGMSGSSIDTPS